MARCPPPGIIAPDTEERAVDRVDHAVGMLRQELGDSQRTLPTPFSPVSRRFECSLILEASSLRVEVIGVSSALLRERPRSPSDAPVW